jgi:hypothetical protein
MLDLCTHIEATGLSDAPLDPKPVSRAPRPGVLARKGRILDEHSAAVGRDPKSFHRSANMALLITDKKDEVEALAKTIETRMGRRNCGRTSTS